MLTCVTWLCVWHCSFIYEIWEMTYSYQSRPCFSKNAPLLDVDPSLVCVCVCDLVYSSVWHNLCVCGVGHYWVICMTWLLYNWNDSSGGHDSIYEWQQSCMCDVTHLCVTVCVWHGSFICVTWLMYVWDVTNSYVWHDSSRFHMYVWHDAFTCDMTHLCVTWLIYVWQR